MPDARCDVDGGPRSLHPLEEVGDGQIAATVLADQRGGDALLHLARGLGVIDEAAIRVAVHIDEPGRHDAAGGIEHLLARPRGQLRGDFDDGVAGYPNVNLA